MKYQCQQKKREMFAHCQKWKTSQYSQTDGHISHQHFLAVFSAE